MLGVYTASDVLVHFSKGGPLVPKFYEKIDWLMREHDATRSVAKYLLLRIDPFP